MLCNCGRRVKVENGSYSFCPLCTRNINNCLCDNINKVFPKITYFDGNRELYSHNLNADKVVIDGKIVWLKNYDTLSKKNRTKYR